jgi:hypothetical protein
VTNRVYGANVLIMKTIWTAFLLVVTLSNCQNDLASINPQTTALLGDWIWIATSGGYGGAVVKPITNEEIILRFEVPNRLSVLRDGTLLYTGIYTTGTGSSIYTGKDALTVQASTSRSSQTPQLIINGVTEKLTPTELSIGDNKFDGYGSDYRRK